MMLSWTQDRSEKVKFVGNAIYFPIQDVHGEMAGKITGCLLDGVLEFEQLVRDPDFLDKHVAQVYNLLVQQSMPAGGMGGVATPGAPQYNQTPGEGQQ